MLQTEVHSIGTSTIVPISLRENADFQFIVPPIAVPARRSHHVSRNTNNNNKLKYFQRYETASRNLHRAFLILLTSAWAHLDYPATSHYTTHLYSGHLYLRVVFQRKAQMPRPLCSERDEVDTEI